MRGSSWRPQVSDVLVLFSHSHCLIHSAGGHSLQHKYTGYIHHASQLTPDSRGASWPSDKFTTQQQCFRVWRWNWNNSVGLLDVFFHCFPRHLNENCCYCSKVLIKVWETLDECWVIGLSAFVVSAVAEEQLAGFHFSVKKKYQDNLLSIFR